MKKQSKRNLKKNIITFSFMILCMILSILFYIGNFLYDIAINPQMDKSIVLDNSLNSVKETIPISSKNSLFNDQKYKHRYIQSEDNIKLHAYEFKQNSDKWAIIVHGYSSDGKQMANSAAHFFYNNYNVLVLDLRSHGKSEGNYIGMGWDDRKDLIQWIHLIDQENKDAQIALYGVSMGASTVLNATGENLPTSVKVAIEDCGYTSTWDIFSYQLDTLFQFPIHPFLDFANTVTKIRAGYSFKEGSPLEQVKKSNTPTLFIHGDQDKFVPYHMVNELFDAANCPKKKLTIKNARHTQCATKNSEKYWNAIYDYLLEYIK